MDIREWSNLELNCVTHYGSMHDYRRSTITVVESGKVYYLSKWFKNCGFNYVESIKFDTMEAAKKAGEEWVKNGK